MDFKVRFSVKGQTLFVVPATDLAGMNAHLSFVNKVLAEAKTGDIRRILLDERAVRNSLEPFEAAVIGNILSELDVQSMGFRMACVVAPCDLAAAKQLETMLVNRSLAFQSFDDMAVARRWLGVVQEAA